MNKELIQQLEPQYHDLQHYIDLLKEDKCKITDVKHRSALLGIYREKDGTYMCRVRRNSGRVSTKNLHDLAEIMERLSIGHAHFSTRQNIQLHGVPATNVYETIKACNAAGMLFRGGGGNTFRSIKTSPRSGVSPTEAFDTIPHADAIWEWISTYERAYGFGRKFKMGISAEPTDDIHAGIQDLGFVAQLKNGERGFKVYCGGGLGRNPGLGIVVIDFLPEKEVIRVVQAAVDLFFENGNRKVRPKARLRFVLQELGPETFKGLFFQYLEEADAPDYVHQSVDYSSNIEMLSESNTSPPEGFELWQKRSEQNTKFGNTIKSVKLHVRSGNVNAHQLRALASMLDRAGIQEIRATASQDILIPLIHTSMLPELYSVLKKELPNVINLDGNFDGQMVSCIGATNCPIGLLKTEKASAHIAHALKALMAGYPDAPSWVYESIIQDIGISGCASSCGLNQISAIGFHGHKKRVDGEIIEFYQLHLGGRINEKEHALSFTNPDWLIKADEIGTTAEALVRLWLESVNSGTTQTLQDFMASKRSSFQGLEKFSLPNILKCIEE